MSKYRGTENVDVSVGDGVVVIRRGGRSASVLANILCIEREPESGRARIWLDRRVHRSDEYEFNGWKVDGAFVTVLSGTLPTG
jgi:hypothetical protein